MKYENINQLLADEQITPMNRKKALDIYETTHNEIFNYRRFANNLDVSQKEIKKTNYGALEKAIQYLEK